MSEELLNQEVATAAKPKKSKKKLLIILVSIVAVLGIAAAIVFSCFGQYQGKMYKNKEEVYSYFDEKPHDSLCYDLSKYEKKLDKLETEYLDLDKEVASAMKQAEPMPEKYDAILQKGNQMLIDFFAEEYGISVEAELAELEVTYTDLPESIAGVHYAPGESQWFETDGKTLALDHYYLEDYESYGPEADLSDWEQSFYSTYIHEAIHYLGGNFSQADGNGCGDFIEGVTEALTQDTLLHGGYSGETDALYILNTELAEQLLVADKDIVVLLFDGPDYIAVSDFIAYFDAKSFDGMGDAIEKSITLAMGHPKTKKYQRMAQHLMGEYLKYYDLTEEQMIEIAESFIAPLSKFSK